MQSHMPSSLSHPHIASNWTTINTMLTALNSQSMQRQNEREEKRSIVMIAVNMQKITFLKKSKVHCVWLLTIQSPPQNPNNNYCFSQIYMLASSKLVCGGAVRRRLGKESAESWQKRVSTRRHFYNRFIYLFRRVLTSLSVI